MQSKKVVLVDGLRSDLVQIDKPWLKEQEKIAKAESKESQIIDLTQAQQALNQAIQTGESKVELEIAAPLLCYRWGPLLPDQVQRVKDSLIQWGGQVDLAEDKAVVGYIVFVPKDAVDAGMNVQKLTELGVTDLFYMRTNGPVQGGISLGIFRDIASAEQQQRDMLAKGVQAAQIGERYGPTRTYLQLLGDKGQIDGLQRIYQLNRQGTLAPCEPVQ